MTPIAVMAALNAKGPGNGASPASAHVSGPPSAHMSGPASTFDAIFATIASNQSLADQSPAAGTSSSPSANDNANAPSANVGAAAQAGDPLQAALQANFTATSTALPGATDSKTPAKTGSHSFDGKQSQADATALIATPRVPLDVVMPATPIASSLPIAQAPTSANQDEGPDGPARAAVGQAGGTNVLQNTNAPNQVASASTNPLPTDGAQSASAGLGPTERSAGAQQNDSGTRQTTPDAKPTDTNSQARDALAQLTGSTKPGPNTFSPPTLGLPAPTETPGAHAATANSGGGNHGHSTQDQASSFAGSQQTASQSPLTAQNAVSGTTSPSQAQQQSHPAQVAASAPAGTVSPTSPISASAPAPVTATVSVVPHTAEAGAGQTPDVGTLAVNIAAKSLGGLKQFDIRLDPPELGRVDVRLSVDDSGKAQAVLAADRPETLHLLKNDAPTLERALKDSGLDLANNGLSFSLKGQERQADAGANQSRNRPFNAKAKLTIEAIGQTPQIPTGQALEGAGLDIRV